VLLFVALSVAERQDTRNNASWAQHLLPPPLIFFPDLISPPAATAGLAARCRHPQPATLVRCLAAPPSSTVAYCLSAPGLPLNPPTQLTPYTPHPDPKILPPASSPHLRPTHPKP
jgi:hypothetical protein